jgi:hypothetical protein
MSVDLNWLPGSALLLASMIIGALIYDESDSTFDAIGYGFGVGLMAVVLTLVGRFIYLRTTFRADARIWGPGVLRLAGIVGLSCVAVIAIAGT